MPIFIVPKSQAEKFEGFSERVKMFCDRVSIADGRFVLEAKPGFIVVLSVFLSEKAISYSLQFD
jgi:hypothetical protein